MDRSQKVTKRRSGPHSWAQLCGEYGTVRGDGFPSRAGSTAVTLEQQNLAHTGALRAERLTRFIFDMSVCIRVRVARLRAEHRLSGSFCTPNDSPQHVLTSGNRLYSSIEQPTLFHTRLLPTRPPSYSLCGSRRWMPLYYLQTASRVSMLVPSSASYIAGALVVVVGILMPLAFLVSARACVPRDSRSHSLEPTRLCSGCEKQEIIQPPRVTCRTNFTLPAARAPRLVLSDSR